LIADAEDERVLLAGPTMLLRTSRTERSVADRCEAV